MGELYRRLRERGYLSVRALHLLAPASTLPVVMPGLDPRLSGLTQCPLEAELGLALWRALLGVEQAIDALAMHEVGAHQSGEGERAFCDPGGVSGEFEQQIGDHGHGD